MSHLPVLPGYTEGYPGDTGFRGQVTSRRSREMGEGSTLDWEAAGHPRSDAGCRRARPTQAAGRPRDSRPSRAHHAPSRPSRARHAPSRLTRPRIMRTGRRAYSHPRTRVPACAGGAGVLALGVEMHRIEPLEGLSPPHGSIWLGGSGSGYPTREIGPLAHPGPSVRALRALPGGSARSGGSSHHPLVWRLDRFSSLSPVLTPRSDTVPALAMGVTARRRGVTVPNRPRIAAAGAVDAGGVAFLGPSARPLPA